MIDALFGGGQSREEKIAKESEQRQMEFTREQNAFSTLTQEDNQEIMQVQQKSDLIRWQQELDKDVLDIVLSFMSLTINGEGRVVSIKDEEGKPIAPICNKLFINQVVIPKLRPFQSKNLINSNYSEDRLLKKLKYTHNTIINAMATNWDAYGIEFNNYDIVIRDMKNFTEDCCWRALNGWTKKTDSTIMKRVETSMDNQNNLDKPKGLFGLSR